MQTPHRDQDVELRDSTKILDTAYVSDVDPPRHVVDGGTRAWSSVVGGWLVLAATFGYTNAFGVYQDLYTRAGDASSSRVSWIGSTQLFFLSAMGVVSGKLLDMGYFRTTNIVGSILYVFSLFMVSLAHPEKYYQVFLSQGVGMGIGAGLLYTPALAVQAHHWRTHRSLAMGIVYTGSAVGGIVYPIMLNQLFHGSAGFGWGVRASAFVILGQLVVANVLMTTNPRKRSETLESKPDIKSIVRDIPYLTSCIATFFTFLGVIFPYFYLQLYSVLHGVDSTISFYTLAIMNASSTFGRTLPNFLADYTGPFNTIVPSCLICGVLVIAMLGIKSTAAIIVFAILYGFSSGAFFSLCTPALATLARDESEIGVRVGLAFAIVSLACLVGTPIEGALLGARFAWDRAIIFSAVMIFVRAGLMTITRQMVAQRKQTWLV